MNELIQANYDTLAQIAQRFQQTAENNTQLHTRLTQQVDQLRRAGWEGRGAATFFSQMDGQVFPAVQRLSGALEQAQSVTLNINTIMQEAEMEAASHFHITADGFIGNPLGMAVGGIEGQAIDTGAVWGWVTDKVGATGNWIADNRDKIALGGALIAAGIATVATGGLAAPIIAGAVVAGGITLGINAASPRYTLFDGVLTNTLKGGVIGLGAGSIGMAVRSIATFGSATGASLAQISGSSNIGNIGGQLFGGIKLMSGVTSGTSTIVAQGGLDLFIPDQHRAQVHHTANQVGMITAVTGLTTSFAGNRLIQHAWNNPQPYAAFSKQFNAHHLFPKQFGGAIDGPSVLISSKNSGFLQNLHTAKGGVHPALNSYLKDLYGVSTIPAVKSMPINAHVFEPFYRNVFVPGLKSSTLPDLLQTTIFAGSR